MFIWTEYKLDKLIIETRGGYSGSDLQPVNTVALSSPCVLYALPPLRSSACREHTASWWECIALGCCTLALCRTPPGCMAAERQHRSSFSPGKSHPDGEDTTPRMNEMPCTACCDFVLYMLQARSLGPHYIFKEENIGNTCN